MSSASTIEQFNNALTATNGSSYDDIAKRLRTAHLLFEQYICNELQEPLNAKLQSIPHGTYDDKQRLAVWLNSELRSFGIAAKCPKTGLACAIHADPGKNVSVGQFRMRPVGDDTRRTFTSARLPLISLIPRPAPKRTYATWAERAGHQVESERELP